MRCNAADGKGILLGGEYTGVHGRMREYAVVGPHLGNGPKGGAVTLSGIGAFVSERELR